MSRTLVFALVSLTPALALAHPGHAHAGNRITHHAMEGLMFAGAVFVTFLFAARPWRKAT